MLGSIFNDSGRQFHLNPCDLQDVKAWVNSCAKEQQQRRVLIKQAKPTFSTHLRLLVAEINYHLASLPRGGPFFPDKFLLLHDQAFFLIQGFSNDRAGDLGRALSKEVVQLEDGSFLFHHTVGKTIRSADGQLLVVPRLEGESALSPVGACESAGVKLRDGYLFPPTASPLHLSVRNAALSSTNTTKRLCLLSSR